MSRGKADSEARSVFCLFLPILLSLGSALPEFLIIPCGASGGISCEQGR